MVQFLDLLKKGWGHLSEIFLLGVIPVIATILTYKKLLAILQFRRFHFGVKFGFPTSIVDVWHFVSTPSGAPGFLTSSFLFSRPLLFVGNALIFIVLQSVLAAGYLGTINESFDMTSFSFVENAGKYLIDFLLYQVLMWFLSLLPLLVALLPFLWIFLFPLVLFIGYLLYGLPFIIVTTNRGFTASLKKSVNLGVQSAQGGTEYLSYGLKYFLFIAAFSIPFTLLVVNLKMIGIIIGTLLVIPLALILNSSTILFFRNLFEQIRKTKNNVEKLKEEIRDQ